MDVSTESPLNGYLSAGDLITKLDGKHIHTSKEWMETVYSLDKQKFETTKHYISNKGYCIPNLVIAESKNAEIVDNQFKCPNDLTLFTTISCLDSSAIKNGSDHQQIREHIYCFPAKGVLGEKKCGEGWDNNVKNDGSCLCTEVKIVFRFVNIKCKRNESENFKTCTFFLLTQDESCSTPIHMSGVAWVEIEFSRPCLSSNISGSEENMCGGTFVFIGDIMLMSGSIWLTEYKPRWLYVVEYIPVVVEKLLVNSFHVSLMLALLNSLPVCVFMSTNVG